MNDSTTLSERNLITNVQLLMTIIRSLTTGLLTLSALTLTTSRAAEIGDPAAPLKISEWVKGKPVSLADAKGKQILVVEFWATWCPPCRTSIPHLTELQKKYRDKDVVFIGVSDEKPAVVKPFVEKMGDKMGYTVAIDDQRKTSAGYMEAYEQGGIPHAFIVDKQGRVVWQGHPMAKLDSALDDLIAGQLDLEKVKKQSQAEAKLQQYYQLVMGGGDDTKTAKLAEELKALDQELGGIQAGRKFDPDQIKKQMGFSRTLRDYQQALATGASAARLAELEKTLKDVAPPGFEVDGFKQQLAASKLVANYMDEVTGDADDAKLAELGRKLGALETDNAQLLNEAAWRILTDSEVKKRDLPLALKLGKAAYDACNGEDAAIVDTYARALFDNGQLTEAIAQQRKAVSLCDDDGIREELKATLQRYEAKAAGR